MSWLLRRRKGLLSILWSRHGYARESGLTSPPPIQVGFSESAGRGVFATRRIGAGELIHTAKPILSHPSLSSLHSVCYFCLKRVTSNLPFCSEECREKSKIFYETEKHADWSRFHDYCRTQGLKYPLLVKRLACMIVSGAATPETLDILQPATLSSEMILLMEKEYQLLRSTFEDAGFTDEQIAFLSKKWYIDVLARIRINSFRIELALGSYEVILLSAAATVEAEAAVGNAIYMLPSFYNHDCVVSHPYVLEVLALSRQDPNTHILWIESVNAKLKALRDIEAGEELRICYIDASMDHDARHAILSEGFGFDCKCARCMSND